MGRDPVSDQGTDLRAASIPGEPVRVDSSKNQHIAYARPRVSAREPQRYLGSELRIATSLQEAALRHISACLLGEAVIKAMLLISRSASRGKTRRLGQIRVCYDSLIRPTVSMPKKIT